jgi:type IV secretion system protein VirD4
MRDVAAWSVLLTLVLVASATTGRSLWNGGRRSVPWSAKGRTNGAHWATRRDLRPLTSSGTGRIAIGRVRLLFWHPLLRAERYQSVAVIGPTQSGKTTGLAIPAILGWEGPVVAASVKTDLMVNSEVWRRSCGTVWCFDPAGTTRRQSNPWSPLPGSVTWDGARRTAADLTEVMRSASTTADSDFWYATAAKLLAPVLFAAATSGAAIHDVVRWVDSQEFDEVSLLLEQAGVQDAIWAFRATWQRDDRQRSAVFTTAETVLEPLVGCPSTGTPVDPRVLLSGRHTLYLCAPAHDQRRHRGVFVAVVKAVLEAAFTQVAHTDRPLDPPLLVVLDEAANIAPVAELDVLAATCAGHGVQLVTIWQDLAQIAARYGPRAATVLNNHRARLFLSGIADPGTLEHASTLIGDEEIVVPSQTVDRTGSRSTTTSTVRRRLLAAEAIRQLPKRTGVLVYGELPPSQVELVPWWRQSKAGVSGEV